VCGKARARVGGSALINQVRCLVLALFQLCAHSSGGLLVPFGPCRLQGIELGEQRKAALVANAQPASTDAEMKRRYDEALAQIDGAYAKRQELKKKRKQVKGARKVPSSDSKRAKRDPSEDKGKKSNQSERGEKEEDQEFEEEEGTGLEDAGLPGKFVAFTAEPGAEVPFRLGLVLEDDLEDELTIQYLACPKTTKDAFSAGYAPAWRLLSQSNLGKGLAERQAWGKPRDVRAPGRDH
jgi:hypothetical protein